MESVLSINGVVKQIKKFTLGAIDFKAEPGTVVALVGPNGSGKSTFFRLIMQLIQTEQGSIKVFGKEMKLNETELKQQIGYAGGGLMESFGHLTIRELSSLIAYWYPSWDQQRYKELLERYEVTEDQKYSHCSSGTQKKVEFIFALAHHPRLLLLDEPTVSVDMISQRKMIEDLMHYMDSGLNSVIMATHMMADVKRLCDYICVLHQGKIIDMFDKDELQHRWARLWLSGLPKHLQSHPYIHEVNENPLQIVTDHVVEVEKMLRTEGITVNHRQQLELDEIMMHLIHQ